MKFIPEEIEIKTVEDVRGLLYIRGTLYMRSDRSETIHRGYLRPVRLGLDPAIPLHIFGEYNPSVTSALFPSRQMNDIYFHDTFCSAMSTAVVKNGELFGGEGFYFMEEDITR